MPSPQPECFPCQIMSHLCSNPPIMLHFTRNIYIYFLNLSPEREQKSLSWSPHTSLCYTLPRAISQNSCPWDSFHSSYIGPPVHSTASNSVFPIYGIFFNSYSLIVCSLSSFRFLLKCHLCKEAFPDNSTEIKILLYLTLLSISILVCISL